MQMLKMELDGSHANVTEIDDQIEAQNYEQFALKQSSESHVVLGRGLDGDTPQYQLFASNGVLVASNIQTD